MRSLHEAKHRPNPSSIDRKRDSSLDLEWRLEGLLPDRRFCGSLLCFPSPISPADQTICTKSGGQSRKFSIVMLFGELNTFAAGTRPTVRFRPSRLAT